MGHVNDNGDGYLSRSGFGTRLRLIASRMPLREEESPEMVKCLELGCRTGELLWELIRAGKVHSGEAYGVDIDVEYLESAREKGIVTSVCDLCSDRLPFSDNTFSYILLSEVIEHIPFYNHLLSEAARCLKPGGELILTTPNLATVRRRLRLLWGSDIHRVYMPQSNDIHYRLFTSASIVTLLECHGIAVKELLFYDLPARSNAVACVLRPIKAVFPSLCGYIFCRAAKK